ncbi:MAG: recombinase family protein [Oscillospiraceae bacterium]|nr:recombinase family protein [Oscillospiraceae bacterium]
MILLSDFPDIAAYCRISVDDELDRDNTSIENQKAIIADFVAKRFPKSAVTYYEDRDRSGYTFEQREGYQRMRPLLMSRKHDILIVKDFSRFSRRNSRGLVELEDLRDAGARIISIGDSVDFPIHEEWLNIQFRFLVNELPVTDASKKVKGVISRRQQDGKWICAVPYGYVITNSKLMTFEIEQAEAEIVRKVFELYNGGWGYKRIANHLTALSIPTPRMNEKARMEARGEESKRLARPEWSIITVEGMLRNDFYIGTLRQGKFTRKKINGSDLKREEAEHIVFENHHEPILDYRTFAAAREQLKKRTNGHYRGVRKYDNVYSGFLFCGDCGSPMFSMSRPDLRPAYTCGAYHRRGLAGCTSHHTRTDALDNLLKSYIERVRDNARDMLTELDRIIRDENREVTDSDKTLDELNRRLEDARAELKATKRQKIREVMKRPEAEERIEATYAELEADLERRVEGLSNHIALTHNRRSHMINVSRIAKTAIDVFNDVLEKEKLDKSDLDLIIERVTVYADRMEIQLKSDINDLLAHGAALTPEKAAEIVQSSVHRKDKVFYVNVISNGDPLEIYTEKDGEVIFKKYSPIGEWSESAGQLCDTMFKTADCFAAIADRDAYISVCGVPKRELADKHISNELEQMMEARHLYQRHEGDHGIPLSEASEKYVVEVAAPILSEGDVLGCVLFFSEGGKSTGEVEYKLAQTVAAFLGKQMES